MQWVPCNRLLSYENSKNSIEKLWWVLRYCYTNTQVSTLVRERCARAGRVAIYAARRCWASCRKASRSGTRASPPTLCLPPSARALGGGSPTSDHWADMIVRCTIPAACGLGTETKVKHMSTRINECEDKIYASVGIIGLNLFEKLFVNSINC